jgi:hypothetical protein
VIPNLTSKLRTTTNLVIFAEPVDMEDLGQFIDVRPILEVEPVLQVLAEVVTKERPHGKRIVHYHLALKITL